VSRDLLLLGVGGPDAPPPVGPWRIALEDASGVIQLEVADVIILEEAP
jgi:hypothetical protein